jgi:hypothetical protein
MFLCYTIVTLFMLSHCFDAYTNTLPPYPSVAN